MITLLCFVFFIICFLSIRVFFFNIVHYFNYNTDLLLVCHTFKLITTLLFTRYAINSQILVIYKSFEFSLVFTVNNTAYRLNVSSFILDNYDPEGYNPESPGLTAAGRNSYRQFIPRVQTQRSNLIGLTSNEGQGSRGSKHCPTYCFLLHFYYIIDLD